MNERQSALLDLVREIDAFCTEHGITYYCAAGTVLGAIRHRGFIPWDDDIDILMTRKEFDRFVRAFAEYGPKDRTVEFYEGDHEHHSPVARYVREGTAMFCHYHITGHASAGILIDIFVLDPIPDGHDAQMEYVAKFYAYCDLIAPTLSYSNRLPDRYSHVLEQYVDEFGPDGVAEAISREIFSCDEDECSCYMLGWGSVPFIYPREFFGTPLRMQFEDMSIPVPSRWAAYLAVHYGSRWYDIPYTADQAQHSSVFSGDTDYHDLYAERDRMYSQEELFALHRGMQAARRKSDALMRQLEPFAADMQIRACWLEIERNLSSTGKTPGSAALYLYERGQYSRLLSIFRPYIDLQTSMPFMGARKHGAFYHWLFPVIVPIEDSTLGCILMALLHTGNMPAAEKITGIYARAGKDSPAARAAADIISRTIEAAGHYYRGESGKALSVIQGDPDADTVCKDHDGFSAGSACDFKDFPALAEIFWLASAEKALTAEEEEELRRLAFGRADIQAGASSEGMQPVSDAETSLAGSPAIRKAWADHLWNSGRRDEAESLYIELMRMSRNGMFRKDIREKGIEIDELPMQGTPPFRGGVIASLRRKLLEEVTDLCDSAGIAYVLSGKLTGSIISGHDIGNADADPEVLMTAESAKRFISAFSKEAADDRRLLSWGLGDPVKDSSLRYVDTASTDCDLRDPSGWDGQHIGVSIRILRSDAAGSLHRKLVRRAERLAAGTDKAWQRRLIFSLSAMGESAAPEKEYYYYAARTGRSPERRSVPASVFSETEEAELNGHRYTVASCFAHDGNTSEADTGASGGGSIFRLKSASAPAGDILTTEDKERYSRLPWTEYSKALKETASYDRKVREVWIRMRDLAIELCSRK